ncbi:S8 family serine peptidase [Aliidiomarina quisquiliarum]|uniref:S8 family serine peptidase n=1 Tax=Aliidiomarina quisquiliarum TaxID=2938947 RepID=UPI00208F6430|nr:S8 family serine peptidase [Aliidiomarina quisquiliarum]MCO4321140.1 S8 family serine peptidase [Aliidiomarina quisquiliarum]
MKRPILLPSKPLLLVSSIALILLSASPMVAADLVTKPRIQANLTDIVSMKGQPKHRLEVAEPSYYIVELEEPALAAYAGTMPGLAATQLTEPANERLNVHSIAAREYGAFLNSRQQSFAQAMQRRLPSAEIAQQYTTAINAVAVRTYDQNAMATLRSLPGVKRVYKNEMRHAQMDTSIAAISATPVWDLAGGRDRAGEGIRIAVIDSGIRPANPMFSGQGMAAPTTRPADDYCALTDMSFCNNKVIVARYSQPTFTINSAEHLSPLDYSGHGSHVAGTAAGAYVTAPYQGNDIAISGVAPGAYLMVYKALFATPTEPGSGSDVMLLEALEHAVRDGADVINNSWGGGPGVDGTDSVYNSVFANIESAGVLLVTAAGNDGPAEQTIGCPGCVEPGITVAAGDMGRVFENLVQYGNKSWLAVPGAGAFSIATDLTAKLTLANQVDATNSLACRPFAENSLDATIVLVDRGECTFVEKATNAQNAGAVGLIVANNEPGTINMALDGVTLPSVAISQTDGAALRANYIENAPITITKAIAKINPAAKNRMASFSSRGPNGNSTFLKPEITAPGVAILSATSPDQSGTDFALNNGTSMATPQVAGAAALLKQLRPELNALQLKSILMGTAETRRMLGTGSTEYATAFAQGAGFLNVAAAAQATFALNKPSVMLNGCLGNCTFTRTIANLTNQSLYLELDVLVGSSLLNTRITINSGATSAPVTTLESPVQHDVHIPAGGSATFTVEIDSHFAKEGWLFPTLIISDTNGNSQEYPIALSNERADDARVLASEVTSGEPSWGEKVTVATLFSGSKDGVENKLTVHFPENLSITNVTANTTNATGSLVANNTFATWTGRFGAVSDNSVIRQIPTLGMSLLDMPANMLLGSVQSIGCTEEICDEMVIPITGLGDLGGLPYNGDVYDTVTVWENGIIAPGDQTAVSATYYNLSMPNSERPNNVIAPLWSDFTIGGDVGGEIYFAAITYDGDEYIVIEWHNAKLWSESISASDPGYTFAVWMRFGAGVEPRVLFNYIDIPSMPAIATIGIEDIYGTSGVQRYFDGDGIGVSTGTALEAIMDASVSQVVLNYEIALNEGHNFTATTEWNTAVSVDVLGQLPAALQEAFGTAVGTTSNGTFEAFTPIRIQPTGARKLEITSSTNNGKVDVIGAKSIRFTPDVKFTGTEVVRYRLVDEANNKTQEYTVSFTVEAKPEGSKKWYEGGLGVIFGMGVMALGFVRLSKRSKLQSM